MCGALVQVANEYCGNLNNLQWLEGIESEKEKYSFLPFLFNLLLASKGGRKRNIVT